MDTPICDFVRDYAARHPLRLHMPGHKGQPFLGPEPMDITEVEGADELYRAEGIIKKSEENAARLFSSARTLYSAEGSSLCVRAMLYLTLLYARSTGRRPLIAAGRNAHRVFLSAAGLLDLEVFWLFPEQEETILSCRITPEFLDQTLSSMEDPPVAVYLTSPDYLGGCLDIRGISAVCRRHNALLLVDNAHGAYLHFLPRSLHPMALGADLCCDSAHKTLPALTGGAYVHISPSAPRELCENAPEAMALFASTSPSYLILRSLDAVNALLDGDWPRQLLQCAAAVSELKSRLAAQGYRLWGQEPMKLTVAPKSYGYTGCALAQILEQNGIVPEFSDPDFVVMMFTPSVPPDGIRHLEKVLCDLPRRPPIYEAPPCPRPAQKVLAIREALLSPRRRLPVSECLGRVLADASVSCPPAVPLVICGERIDSAALAGFAYYGISSCTVVAEEG